MTALRLAAGPAVLVVDLDDGGRWTSLAVDGLELLAGQPVTLGWHPWFVRRLPHGGPLALRVHPGGRYLRDRSGLPTRELGAAGRAPYDDCFVDVADPPVLTWPGALELTLVSATRTWVLYDRLPEALCVEPQTGPPDAVNLGLSEVVEAGQEVSLGLGLRWRLLDAERARGSDQPVGRPPGEEKRWTRS